jgi:hypothetical protein
MKSIFLVISLVLAQTLSAINLKDVPAAVQTAVNNECVGDIVSLSKEDIKGNVVYEVVTETLEDRKSYFFSQSGRLIHKTPEAAPTSDEDDEFEDEDEDFDEEEEEEDDNFELLRKRQLPEHIQKAIKKNVKGDIQEYGREVIYFVEAEEDDKVVFYVFNHKGKLIEKEVEGEDDEDDDEDEDDEDEDDDDDEDEDEDEDEEDEDEDEEDEEDEDDDEEDEE